MTFTFDDFHAAVLRIDPAMKRYELDTRYMTDNGYNDGDYSAINPDTRHVYDYHDGRLNIYHGDRRVWSGKPENAPKQ